MRVSGYISTLSGLLVSVAVAAQDDSLTIVQRAAAFDGEVDAMGEAAFEQSSAASIWRHRTSLSSLALRYDMRSEEQALLPAYGDGLSSGTFDAGSYLKIDDRTTVQAAAAYTRGSKRNVLWNSSSDFMLLWPHITADSVGGDLITEQYSFGGSYARSYDRFAYGLGASYRALHEFRRVDPRPRNITSDLDAGISGGYNTDGYYIGLAAGVRIYRQLNTVSYNNTSGANTSQLPMTGLGTYFDRFAGTGSSSTSLKFRGTGYSVSMQAVPHKGSGFLLAAEYGRFSVSRLLTAENYAPITALYTDTWSATAAFRSREGRTRWGVELMGSYQTRRGDENVIDNGSQGVNYVLGTFTMFDAGVTSASLKGAVEFHRSGGYAFIRPYAEMLDMDARYRYPQRSMTFTTVTGGCDFGIKLVRERFSADAAIGAGYLSSPSGALHLAASTETAIRTMVNGVWNGIIEDKLLLNASLGFRHAVGRALICFFDADWRMYGSDRGAGHILAVEAGLKF